MHLSAVVRWLCSKSQIQLTTRVSRQLRICAVHIVWRFLELLEQTTNKWYILSNYVVQQCLWTHQSNDFDAKYQKHFRREGTAKTKPLVESGFSLRSNPPSPLAGQPKQYFVVISIVVYDVLIRFHEMWPNFLTHCSHYIRGISLMHLRVLKTSKLSEP